MCSRRTLFAGLPGNDPFADALVRDAFAAIERGEGFGDAGDLPLVDVEIGNDRFGGEERTAPTGALGEFLQPRFC